MTIRIFGLAALLLCVGLIPLAFAADDLTDEEFVKRALASGDAEVKFGQLADKRASSEKVKQFAERMVKDHKAANEKLTRHASNQKIAVVLGVLNSSRKDFYNRLSKLEGKEFDREYMNQMVKDHEIAVNLFEKEAKNGRDPELKKFAADTLPTLKKHLERAKKIAADLKGE